MKSYLIKDRDFVHVTFVTLSLLVVYVLCAPHTVVFEDDGLFILAAYYNGIAHPPGYPLYTLLSHLMTWLPVGSVAYRVHILSGVFGSLACGVLWAVMNRLVPGKVYAYATSFTFGFSNIFWSQAIVSEVYTLNVLLILVLIALVMEYTGNPNLDLKNRGKWLGFFYGLSLANHWPLTLLSTPMLLILVWPRIRHILVQIPTIFFYLLVGLLPYAWLVIRSHMEPQISFYGPMESFSDFWFMISRSGYEEIDQSYSAGLWDKWMYCIYVFRECANQFHITGLALVILGCIFQRKVLSTRTILALAAGFIFNTFILIGLLGFDYDLLHQIIFRVYPIVAYLILSIWLGIGLFIVLDRLKKYITKNLNFNIIASSLSALLIFLTFTNNLHQNYRADDYWVENYAMTVLNNLEPDSIFIAGPDSATTTTAYFNMVENFRNDIQIYHTQGLLFKNRIFKYDSMMSEETRKDFIYEFISNSNRTVQFDDIPEGVFSRDEFGLFTRIDISGDPSQVRFIFNPEIFQFFEYMFEMGEPMDPWQKVMYRYYTSDYCFWTSGLAAFTPSQEKQQFFQEMVDRHCHGFYGYLGKIRKSLLEQDIDSELARDYFMNAKGRDEEAITKEDKSSIYNYYALALINSDQLDEAGPVLQESIIVWPHPDNDALDLLGELPGNE